MPPLRGFIFLWMPFLHRYRPYGTKEKVVFLTALRPRPGRCDFPTAPDLHKNLEAFKTLLNPVGMVSV